MINAAPNESLDMIGIRAVRQSQEENHRLGLPNIYLCNGRIIYEMPDCEIIVNKIPPKNYLFF